MGKNRPMTAAQALERAAGESYAFEVPVKTAPSQWDKEFARGMAAAAADKNYEGVGGPVNFDELDDITRLEILNQTLAIDEVRQATQRRNAALFEDTRHCGRDRRASVRYENADRLLAEMIGFNIIGTASRCGGMLKSYQMRQAMNGIDESDPEMRAYKQRCAWSMEGALFLADLLDKYLNDVNDSLRKMFHGKSLSFDMFADVQMAMSRLARVFGKTRDKASDEQRQLFNLYAESINQYLDKRVNTFMRKSEELRRKNINKKEAT